MVHAEKGRNTSHLQRMLNKKQACTASNVLWFLNTVKDMLAVSEGTVWVKSPQNSEAMHMRTDSCLFLTEVEFLQLCPDATHWIAKLTSV